MVGRLADWLRFQRSLYYLPIHQLDAVRRRTSPAADHLGHLGPDEVDRSIIVNRISGREAF